MSTSVLGNACCRSSLTGYTFTTLHLRAQLVHPIAQPVQLRSCERYPRGEHPSLLYYAPALYGARQTGSGWRLWRRGALDLRYQAAGLGALLSTLTLVVVLAAVAPFVLSVL